MNKDLIMACRSNSIQSNPFYMAETRDVFRKLIGCCKSYPLGLKNIFLHQLACPVFGMFGGSIYHILRRWLYAREVTAPEKYLQKCWECPPELKSDSFVPLPYHRHLLARNGDKVDELLFKGCFGIFSSHRVSPSEGHSDSKEDDGPQFSKSYNRIFESYVDFMSTRDWIPSDKLDCEDICSEFNDYLRDKAEDFEEEELRRCLILKMAEKKFRREIDDEGNKSLHTEDKPKEKKPNKPENKIKNDTCNGNILKSPAKPETTPSSKQPAAKNILKNDPEEIISNSKQPVKTTTNKNKSQDNTDSVSLKESSEDKALKAQLSHTYVGVKKDDKQCQVHISVVSNCPPTSNQKSKKKKKNKKPVDTPASTQTKSNNTSEAVTQTDAKAPTSNGSKKLITAPKQNSIPEEKSKGHLSNSTITLSNDSAGTSKTINNKQNSVTNVKKKEAPSTSKTDVSLPAAKGSNTDLVTIKKNIDTIQQAVQEKNELSLDGFRLMVETGSLLMSGNSKGESSKTSLQSCSQCRKVEEKPKSFKKCARCKIENVKWVRYYCSRECQAENWVQCHQEEHEKNQLVKN